MSGGINEPRDGIALTIWALLTHPRALASCNADQALLAQRVRGALPLDLTGRDGDTTDHMRRRAGRDDDRRRIDGGSSD